MVSTLVKIVYLHWNKSTQIAALFLSSFIDVSPNFFNLSETTPMAPWHPIGDTPGGPLNLLQSSRVQHRKGWRLWFPIWHLVQWSQTNCPRISSFIGAAKRQASNLSYKPETTEGVKSLKLVNLCFSVSHAACPILEVGLLSSRLPT